MKESLNMACHLMSRHALSSCSCPCFFRDPRKSMALQINLKPIIVGQQEALDLPRRESSGNLGEETTTSPTLKGQ